MKMIGGLTMTRSSDYYDDYYDDYPRDMHPGSRPGDDYPAQRGYQEDQYQQQREPPRRHDNRGDQPTYKQRRRPKTSKVKSAVGLTVRVLILVFLIMFFLMPQMEPYRNQFLEYLEEGLYHYKQIPDYMIFNINRDMTIENSMTRANGGTVVEFTLTIDKPFEFEDENENVIQELKDITTSFEEDKYITERETDKQLEWKGFVDPGDEVTITVYYKLKSAHIIWEIGPDDSGTINDIPENLKRQYNHDDWKVKDLATGNDINNPYDPALGDDFYRIHPSDPYIKELAESIKGDETNVYKILKKFYDFLNEGEGSSLKSEGCAYPDQFQMDESRKAWSGMPKPARATLEDWVGDCDDQSFLLISMLRAVNIPARVEAGGLWDSIAGEWGGHGWAQVYLPVNDGNDAWVIIDIVNDYFLERDPFRFTDYIGNGKPETLENYYISWEYSGGVSVDIEEEYFDVGHTAIAGDEIVFV